MAFCIQSELARVLSSFLHHTRLLQAIDERRKRESIVPICQQTLHNPGIIGKDALFLLDLVVCISLFLLVAELPLLAIGSHPDLRFLACSGGFRINEDVNDVHHRLSTFP